MQEEETFRRGSRRETTRGKDQRFQGEEKTNQEEDCRGFNRMERSKEEKLTNKVHDNYTPMAN